MELKRVVITGVGALTPIGNTASEFWQGLKSGQSGAAPITHFDASKFKTQFACEVKGFDPLDHIDRKEARKMDPFAQYAMVVCTEAVADAGLIESGVDPDRVGVVLGSGIGGLYTFQQQVLEFGQGDGTPRFNPFFIPKMISDIAPGHVSMKFGFRGPNYTTVSACASATNALIDSFNLIRLGKADVIVSGGSEACVHEAGVGGFNALHALSQRNDSPATASRPFDKERDGFVLGEGAASLILEEYEHAKARGAKIYGEMVGGGLSADAHHLTAPHPEGLGAMNVMKNALKDAGLSPTDIDYINVHGTSTPLGDVAEAKAILHVFGEHSYDLSISSTKSMTGHLLGAAGAVEAFATLMAVKEDIVPPTINFKVPDEDIDQRLDFTFNEAKKRPIRAGLSNTFGFGGHNASVIFKKAE
ncbi:MAG: beta-ketoacyl-ACP synthase II [Flavobacteriales bacterium]|nr:beta-ketoacyl-ACP synthase II [Flavobacteriales bacterium]